MVDVLFFPWETNYLIKNLPGKLMLACLASLVLIMHSAFSTDTHKEYSSYIWSHRALRVLFSLLESEPLMLCNIKTLFFGLKVAESNGINDLAKIAQ